MTFEIEPTARGVGQADRHPRRLRPRSIRGGHGQRRLARRDRQPEDAPGDGRPAPAAGLSAHRPPGSDPPARPHARRPPARTAACTHARRPPAAHPHSPAGTHACWAGPVRPLLILHACWDARALLHARPPPTRTPTRRPPARTPACTPAARHPGLSGSWRFRPQWFQATAPALAWAVQPVPVRNVCGGQLAEAKRGDRQLHAGGLPVVQAAWRPASRDPRCR